MPTYEELLKRNRGLLAENKQKALEDSDKIYDTQITDVTASYNNAIDEAKHAYEDEYERNAVNREILKKRIAEKNANLGLTQSGLNATEQAAAELSYNNTQGKIDIARQKSVDNLAAKLAEAVSSINTNKASARGSIEQSYEKLAADNAQSEYKTNVEAETELYKAMLSASKGKGTGTGTKNKSGLISVNGGLISRDFSGTLKDNRVDVIKNAKGTYTYVDNNSGKKTTLDAGVNPYTGGVHKDLLDKYGQYNSSKSFSNGYQPNNVGGKKLSKFDTVPDGAKAGQTVWKANGKYYIWFGEDNDYVEVKQENGVWVAV